VFCRTGRKRIGSRWIERPRPALPAEASISTIMKVGTFARRDDSGEFFFFFHEEPVRAEGSGRIIRPQAGCLDTFSRPLPRYPVIPASGYDHT